MDNSNRKYVVIKVDTNDGDYAESINEITEDQALALSTVAKAIKEFVPYEYEMFEGHMAKHEHNFPTGEMVRKDSFQLNANEYYVGKKLVTQEEYDVFMHLAPYCEYGFHTVEEIKVLAVIGEIKLI